MRKLGDSPGIECWLLRQDAPHRHAGFYRIANCDAISMVRMTAMIRLLPYDPSYLASFVEWRAQQLSVRHNPLQSMNEQDIAQMLKSEGSDLSDLKKYEKYRWFVECDGVAVGSVKLKNISHTMGYAEIGYGIGETHHRQGIATAAVALLIRMCFCDSPCGNY